MDVRLPKVGDRVNVIEKRNYESGQLTTGIVRRTLSNPHEVHPRGNKVELEDGAVGRMVSFVDEVGEQSFVDPALREQLAQEVRSQSFDSAQDKSPEGKRQNSDVRHQRTDDRGGRRDFQNRPDRPDRPERFERYDRRFDSPAPEPSIKPSDLPGEDDLR